MFTLVRNGLILSSISDMQDARGSKDVPIALESDDSYAEFVESVHCGFMNGEIYMEVILAKSGDNYIIPEEAFYQASPIRFSVELSNTEGTEFHKTNEVNTRIKNAPHGKVILPSTDTWQKLVSDYTQGLLNVYTTEVLNPAVNGVTQSLNTYTSDVLTPAETRITNSIEEFETTYGDAYTPTTETVFEESEEELNIETGETIPTILGKIKKIISRIGLTPLTTTAKNLSGGINELNSKLINKVIQVGDVTIVAGGNRWLAISSIVSLETPDGYTAIGILYIDTNGVNQIGIGGYNLSYLTFQNRTSTEQSFSLSINVLFSRS